MLIELRATEFNRGINLFRGLERFNLGLANRLSNNRDQRPRILSDVMKMSQVYDGSVANSFNRNLIVPLHSEDKGRKKEGDA